MQLDDINININIINAITLVLSTIKDLSQEYQMNLMKMIIRMLHMSKENSQLFMGLLNLIYNFDRKEISFEFLKIELIR